jgi:hypothetical protein
VLVGVHGLCDVFRAVEGLPIWLFPQADVLVVDRGVEQGPYNHHDDSLAAALCGT